MSASRVGRFARLVSKVAPVSIAARMLIGNAPNIRAMLSSSEKTFKNGEWCAYGAKLFCLCFNAVYLRLSFDKPLSIGFIFRYLKAFLILICCKRDSDIEGAVSSFVLHTGT